MSIFAAAFVIVFSLFAIVLPWAGVFAYYIFSVMQMQDLFPHDFGAVSYTHLTLPTILLV